MQFTRKPGVTLVIDGQWGSTGKGKLGAWLGEVAGPWDAVVSSFGPNSGHTTVTDDGKVTVLKCMPSAALTTTCPVFITPDSVFFQDRLMEEAAIVGEDRVVVHPLAAVAVADDKVQAASTGMHISGTMQGTGHAIARKMLRGRNATLARDVLPGSMVGDICERVRRICSAGGRVLLEVSQGFDLSLNHGTAYPYLTSRDITTASAMNGIGIPPRLLGQVVGCIRTFPIRVGNVADYTSGPHWPDQVEMKWRDIGEASGLGTQLIEHTTVTKRVRRVFSFSDMQLRHFVDVCSPDYLFVNFLQYLDATDAGVTHLRNLSNNSISFIGRVEAVGGVPVLAAGTGPRVSDVVLF